MASDAPHQRAKLHPLKARTRYTDARPILSAFAMSTGRMPRSFNSRTREAFYRRRPVLADASGFRLGDALRLALAAKVASNSANPAAVTTHKEKPTSMGPAPHRRPVIFKRRGTEDFNARCLTTPRA
jgi:hypothetical protein